MKIITACFYFNFILYSNSVEFFNSSYRNVIVKMSNSVTKETIEELEVLFTDSSKLLYTATNQKAFFGQITLLFNEDAQIELPSKSVYNNATWETLQKPTFKFSTNVNEIKTRQNAFCGVINNDVVLPLNVTKNKLAPRYLVRNWSKYRYGVFDEEPLVSKSSCYYDNDKWKATGCYDVDHNPDLLQIEESKGVYGCTNPGTIELFENITLKSSMMVPEFLELSSVVHFCNDASFPHNSLAPTKHNFFCHGRSVGNVIESSMDFQNTVVTELKTPEFLYVRVNPPRIILVVQNKISVDPKISIVLEFFYQYVMGDLVEVGLVTISDSVLSRRELAPVKKNTELFREFKWTIGPPETKHYVIEGLDKATTMFGDDIRTNIVLLIADSTVLNSVSTYNTTIGEHTRNFAMPILSKNQEQIEYEKLLDRFSRSDLYPLLSTKLENQELAQSYLVDILNRADGRARVSSVYQTTFYDIDNEVSGNFSIAGHVDATLVFKVHCDEYSPKEYEVLLNGEKVQNYNLVINSYSFTSKDLYIEDWTFTLKPTSGKNISYCSIYAIVIENTNDNDGITTSLRTVPSEDISQQVVLLNVDLGFQSPLKGAVTVETINLVDLSRNQFKLNDNGLDPDLFLNDGLFTNYFAFENQAMSGVYFASVYSSYIHGSNRLARHDYVGVFVVPESYSVPPKRIGDLQVSSVDIQRNVLVLTWTDPTLSLYPTRNAVIEAKYGKQLQDLNSDHFENAQLLKINSTINTPTDGEFLTIEMVCEFPEEVGHFYVAVKTLNSLVSNRVQVINDRVSETTSSTSTSNLSSVVPNTTTSNPNCNCTINKPIASWDNNLSKSTLIIILVCSLVGFFLLVIICNLLVCWGLVKDKQLTGWYRFKKPKNQLGTVTIVPRDSNQSTLRRNTLNRPALPPANLVVRDLPMTPNHLINNNLRRSASPQFITISNESPETDTDTLNISDRPPVFNAQSEWSINRQGRRRAPTQNRLVFDGSSSEVPSHFTENPIQVEATNPIYDSSSNNLNRPHRNNSFYLGEV